MTEYQVIGHCGRIFKEFEICEECKMDDLCLGCSMNDEEYDDEDEWEEGD